MLKKLLLIKYVIIMLLINMYMQNILKYPATAHLKIKVFVISFLMLQFLKHSLFFLHCHCNSLRSDNQLANRFTKTAHKKLSRKENEITWEYPLKADIKIY